MLHFLVVFCHNYAYIWFYNILQIRFSKIQLTLKIRICITKINFLKGKYAHICFRVGDVYKLCHLHIHNFWRHFWPSCVWVSLQKQLTPSTLLDKLRRKNPSALHAWRHKIIPLNLTCQTYDKIKSKKNKQKDRKYLIGSWNHRNGSYDFYCWNPWKPVSWT